jgi:hypothetical protein
MDVRGLSSRPFCPNADAKLYQVFLVDTGDKVEVAFFLSGSERVLDLARQLYGDIDVSIRFEDTNILADVHLIDFVNENLLTSILWSDNANKNMLADLTTCLDFWTMKTKSSCMQNNAKQKANAEPAGVVLDATNSFEVQPYEHKGLLELKPLHITPIPSGFHVESVSAEVWNDFATPILGPDWRTKNNPLREPADAVLLPSAKASPECSNEPTIRSERPSHLIHKGQCECKIDIIYSKFYKVAFLTRESSGLVKSLCNGLPDLVHMRTIQIPHTHVKTCYEIFHHRYFIDEKVLKLKIESFGVLFAECSLDNSSKNQYVNDLLKTFYIVDDQEANKMKASILFQKVANLMRITDEAKVRSLKQRLPVYMMDAGLKKKRLAEGYFYFGIREIEQSDDTKTMDIDTLCKIREKEIKSLPYPRERD